MADGKIAASLSLAQIVVGAVLGSFLGGAGVVAWGDARYARREEFVSHAQRDAAIQYATSADLDAHKREGHDFTKVQLAAIQSSLAAIQTDLAWLKSTTLLGRRLPPREQVQGQ